MKALMFPNFSYCGTVIIMTKKLTNMLKILGPTFSYLNRDDHVSEFYKQISISKLNTLKNYHILLLLLILLFTKLPCYLGERFVYSLKINSGDI